MNNPQSSNGKACKCAGAAMKKPAKPTKPMPAKKKPMKKAC
jgi:hypothetical protein